jgi:hypothetical protein
VTLKKHKWSKEEQAIQNEKLELVFERIRHKTNRQMSTLAIFDLDGTLFDNRTRTMFILREISEKFADEVPQLVEAFDSFQELSLIEYGLQNTLANFKIADKKELACITREWEKRFFTDEYQKFDIPLPGAKSYVSRVHEAGATIIYLTGRDVSRMLVGTAESLRMFGFPVGIVGTMMIVKKEFEEKDEIFKRDVVSYLKRLGSIEAIFENEPMNSNILARAFPDALSFLVLTQHRPDAPSLDKGIFHLRDFRIRA